MASRFASTKIWALLLGAAIVLSVWLSGTAGFDETLLGAAAIVALVAALDWLNAL